MRKLLSLYIVTLGLAHFGWMGPLRYIIISAVISAILMIEGRVFISRNYSYNVGGLLLVGSGLYASITMNVPMSYAYVLFMSINILILPGLTKYKLTRRHMMYIALYFSITLLHIVFLNNIDRDNWYGNSNNYATVILCSAYFSILAFSKKPIKQLLTIPLFLTLMFISASRTQLAGLLGFYLLYFGQTYILRVHFRRLIFFGVVGMFVLYGTLITGDPFGIIGVVQENTIGHKSYRGLSYRDVLFFISVDIVRNYPFGVGWSEAGYYIYDYFGETLSPHNTYMKVAVEGGILALVGFLLMHMGMIYRAATPLVSSFMVAMVLRALFESSTPMTLSLVSAMLFLPFFLNERTVTESERPGSPDLMPKLAF